MMNNFDEIYQKQTLTHNKIKEALYERPLENKSFC